MNIHWIHLSAGLVVLSLIMTNVVAEQAAEREWGADVVGCRLSLAADAKAYRFDQPIHVDVILENRGHKPVTVSEGEVVSDLAFEVLLPDGKTAPMTLEGKRRAGMPGGELVFRDLPPNASITARIECLDRFYDMTLSGVYSITATRKIWLDNGNMEPDVVISNTLRIEVHEQKAEPTVHGEKS